MLHLSQGHLTLLETCPRRFQHSYLDQLSVPVAFDQQQRLNWGNQFHLLMQQRELGLPIHDLAGLEVSLQQSMETLIQAAPELFQPTSQSEPEQVRQSEHRRILSFQGYLLTVIYDLLVLSPQSAHILDWKTYARPQNSRWLAQHWQTRLYLFVLAETSDYLPEQLAMTYWFIQVSPEQTLRPDCLNFTYSSALHQQTRQDLSSWLDRLTQWQRCYETGQPFPQLPDGSKACQTCSFALRCERGRPSSSDRGVAAVPSLADIEEIAL
jgi:hypothetical protein